MSATALSPCNSFNAQQTLHVAGQDYLYYSLPEAAKTIGDISRLPLSLKILLENLLRHEDGRSVHDKDIVACAQWLKERRSTHEIAYRPVRVLMQDFTGVPAIVDLASMRDAMAHLGGNPETINPLSTCNLVIDHSVMVDESATAHAIKHNIAQEFERNGERYGFLKWGQQAFRNFTVVPPGTGICHQVNLEFLSRAVWSEQTEDGQHIAMPDTLVGTDSHTTMVNGMGVLGWGVGGIEAEAAMLGQPVSMILPEVLGCRLDGTLPEGATATDLVLTIVQCLRARGVVGKFVEFFGPGVGRLSLADRATIANMAPEYGATCGFFPIDAETLRYMRSTGRDENTVALVESYAKVQGLWRDDAMPEPAFSDVLVLDMSTITPCLAGPKRPQDRIELNNVAKSFQDGLIPAITPEDGAENAEEGHSLTHGDVVLAAITSCTNTSNPSALIAAGLLAKNARARGLQTKSWVKTSLAPGSQVVADYLDRAGLQESLNALGFHVVGFGCTTCIGNSGPLPAPITNAIEKDDLIVAGVLSGNRNFEGRIHSHIRANYLASPPLVVAYALTGRMTCDLTTEPVGRDEAGQDVYLRDIWPGDEQIQATIARCLDASMFRARYDNVYQGPEEWRAIKTVGADTYDWNDASTYVKKPPYFDGITAEPIPVQDIKAARPLLLLADSITTDHISPAGAIRKDSPAGEYLLHHQVRSEDFNSYGARRGNHEVMMRGTFANIRIRNEMAPGTEGGVTRLMPEGITMSVYDAAMRYGERQTPLIVIGGKEYGTGSSRDWAAKGTRLLGVKAVIVESFERIHRSNLVGMGVMPLQFKDGETRRSLQLDGSEVYDIGGIEQHLAPRTLLPLTITRTDGNKTQTEVLCRIDTEDELEYYRHGGILHYVLRNLAKRA